jgi:carbon-monoxide dehydrogenase small subunit
MKTISLTVNGKPVTSTVEPRLQLADFLREHQLLTGTHLGCEHGICGACTILIDNEPARSCITYAVACDGAVVTTIEGLEDDETMAELRQAFSREHALQCGYCTPGMLMTGRDIVLRLLDADERRIRLELSGNLCRCTGYVGIVRAIRSVLAEHRRRAEQGVVSARLWRLGPVGARVRTVSQAPSPVLSPASGRGGAPARSDGRMRGRLPHAAGAQPITVVTQSFTLGEPLEKVWRSFKDIELLASCLPGASLTKPVEDGRVEGQIRIKLGPIAAAFAGEGEVQFDDARHSGTVWGMGRDSLSSSQARGEIEFLLTEAGGGTRVDVGVGFSLQGPLAQFSRGAIVNDLAARLSAEFARNLDARMQGGAAPQPAAQLNASTLLFSVLWARIKALFRKR